MMVTIGKFILLGGRVERSVIVHPGFNYLFVGLIHVSTAFTVINHPTDNVHFCTCLLISLPVCPCLCLSVYLTLSMHDEVMNVDGCWSSLILSNVHLSPPPRTAISFTDARTAAICGVSLYMAVCQILVPWSYSRHA